MKMAICAIKGAAFYAVIASITASALFFDAGAVYAQGQPQKYISKVKEINLEAYQFSFSPDVIEVRKGDTVKIFATSRDVTHGIHIKEYNINEPIKKGQITKIEFVADKAGEFDIVCSVYCGKGHNTMKAKLVVRQ